MQALKWLEVLHGIRILVILNFNSIADIIEPTL